MKKYLNYSFGYAIAAMIGGIFYREFTKWNDFTGITALGKLHVHLFMLGTVMFLLIALFSENHELKSQKTFRIFMYVYNIGLALTTIMLLLRGITQVLHITLSSEMNASFSGIAGIGHMLVGIGLILLFLSMKNTVKNRG